MNPEQLEQLKQRLKTDVGMSDAQVNSYLRSRGISAQQSRQPQGDGVLKSIVKDPLKELLVRPATRTAQAGIALLGGERGKDFAMQDQTINFPILGDITIPGQKTGAAGVRQIAGDAAKSASYLYAPSQVSGVGSAAMQGLKTGAKAGFVSGGLYGAGSGVQKDDASIGSVFKEATTGALGGAAVGGALGGALGYGLSKLSGRRLTDVAMEASFKTKQPQSRFQSILDRIMPVKSKPLSKEGLSSEALKQGFTQKDVDFLTSVSKADKPVMQKMLDVTVKAQSNARQTERAADILGNSIVNRVRQVQTVNKNAGKLVDEAAKGLRGLMVETEPLRNTIVTELDNLGVAMTQDGRLDFSQSVFKNVPKIQKEIQKVVDAVPDGSDAYQLHIFKKTLDELLDFGTAGEGLKGNASRLLKNVRKATDEILDGAFSEYDEANSLFSYTKEFLEEAAALAGKKVELTSKAGEQAFGQAIRSAFSNNKSRGLTLEFLMRLQKIADELGLDDRTQNLLDQAIFVNIIEDVFGTQAATGLAGEVQKAIKGTQRVIQGIRDPLSGAADLVSTVVEKAQNISPEQKRKVLEMFLKSSR